MLELLMFHVQMTIYPLRKSWVYNCDFRKISDNIEEILFSVKTHKASRFKIIYVSPIYGIVDLVKIQCCLIAISIKIRFFLHNKLGLTQRINSHFQ
jgi:hypothetical protein